MRAVVTRPIRRPHRALFWLACLYAILVAGAAAALEAIPTASSLLVDEAGALTDADKAMLRDRLKAIQDAGHAQVGILISNDVRGESLPEYSMRVADSWKLGHAGRDDGLLILVVPSRDAARIEIGYGLEGVIPDVRAAQWLDEFLAALKDRKLTDGLRHLLDRIVAALPPDEATEVPSSGGDLLDRHPEWKLPFVLAVFSPFALFPLFAGRWGSIASSILFAAFAGGAAASLWHSTLAGVAGAAVASPFPLLWGLNRDDDDRLAYWQRMAKIIGNVFAVALFFSVVTLFVGMGLSAADVRQVWVAPLFAGLLAIGVAAFLFPGRPAHGLMVVLRSAVHFVFILAITYVGLQPIFPDPTRIAFAAAAAITAIIALGLYLDARESDASVAGVATAKRWSLWLFGLALIVTIPLAMFALVMAIVGDAVHMRLVQAAAGGVSLAGALGLAARVGLIAAVKVGLGGRFGGGGAGRG
jgi:uncharacterized protein